MHDDYRARPFRDVRFSCHVASVADPQMDNNDEGLRKRTPRQ